MYEKTGSNIFFILCVYQKDRPEFLSMALNSCLDQTIECNIYIYVDGFIDTMLDSCLKRYDLNERVKIFYGKENKGLAHGLNFLVEYSLNMGAEFIFRMDADDISNTSRVEKQLQFFKDNPEVDVVGSDVIEIDEDGNELFYKKMEKNQYIINRDIIKKCPLNHPSTAFRRCVFESGMRYNSSLKNTQDYYLWVDLLHAGFTLSNINEPLLKFRVDSNFHKRRGLEKAINDVKSRLYALNKLRKYSFLNYVHIILLFCLRVSPTFFKKFAYRKFR